MNLMHVHMEHDGFWGKIVQDKKPIILNDLCQDHSQFERYSRRTCEIKQIDGGASVDR